MNETHNINDTVQFNSVFGEVTFGVIVDFDGFYYRVHDTHNDMMHSLIPQSDIVRTIRKAA